MEAYSISDIFPTVIEPKYDVRYANRWEILQVNRVTGRFFSVKFGLVAGGSEYNLTLKAKIQTANFLKI